MPSATNGSSRIYSIDVLRGLVMIIMALDHVRDFFHHTASVDSPTNLATTTPALFFTRWITHFCAPIFVFLAGLSAYRMGLKKTKQQLSVFLIKRGLWLIFVEILIVSFGWTFDPAYHVLILQVIWAIGICMIALGLFVWLPVPAIGFVGLAIIGLHNFIDYAETARHGHVGLIWEFAHHGQFRAVPYAPHHVLLIVYAFLPWLGIMMTGYGLGKLYSAERSSPKRKRTLGVYGMAALVLFVVLRLINRYGDPAPWSAQRNTTYSLLSFLNVTKYPPSLDYILLTIGVALILLALLDGITKDSFSFARVFGRVPFFYYVVHLYMIHAIGVLFFFLEKYPATDIAAQHLPFLFRPDRFGFGLIGVYLIWIAVVLLMYPLCKRYNRFKSTHTYWWLSYI